jgi:tRNA pseudouridine32 synthase / 23S rRNA pseudouridine746 synthase
MPTALPDILHRCDDFLIVDKPAGLLTVPGKGPEKWDCLINRLLPTYPNARIVHRLDQPTSGLLVVPLGYEPLKRIGRQFELRQVSKTYQAVLNGLVANNEGEVDLPLICDWPNRPRQMVDHENGKPALTRYRVLSRDAERQLTRVELTPVTGRSHQLRVHMLALGHPILGDTLYTPEWVFTTASRLHLHACTLAFDDPGDGTRVSFRSAPTF